MHRGAVPRPEGRHLRLGAHSPRSPAARSRHHPRPARVVRHLRQPGLRPVARQRAATLPRRRKTRRPCGEQDAQCDPMSLCNDIRVCSDTDPTLGGCPISRASYKREIRYIERRDLVRYRDELLHIRLATWRYAHDPKRKRLGFLIDDDEGSVAVDASRDRVDLYGYTSLAIAALQAQAHEIEALERRIAKLEAKLAIGTSRPAR